MKSPICSEAQKHQESISANQLGKSEMTKERLYILYQKTQRELDAAREVIHAVESSHTLQSWFVIDALKKYYEVTR
jgi:hypothetical protein